MIRTQTVRLYPTPKQTAALVEYLEVARLTYNWALDLKLLAWGNNKINLSKYDLFGYLTWLRSRSDCRRFRDCPCDVERDAITRVDFAFAGFFQRLKQGKKPGFPRFKGKGRIRSFVANSNVITKSGRICIPKITPIKCRGLQPILGKIKRLRILKKANKWLAQLVVDDQLPTPPKVSVNKAVGIDVGLNHFAATTDGQLVDNPRTYRQLERQLRRASQDVSRKVKGSNRRKAIIKLQLVHERIVDIRTDFLHKLSSNLVNRYDLIAIEDLSVAQMIRGHNFGKSISDASWATFFHYLTYKAESAGKIVMKVDPRGTSQLCSFCERIVPKDLSVRIHNCNPGCGLMLDRDINAARNILFRAVLEQTHGRWAQACGEVVRLTDASASLSKPLRSRNSSPEETTTS